MNFNYNKLRGRIIEKYNSQAEFAEKIGLSKNSVSKKMQCKSRFTQEDIAKWCDALGIPIEEAGLYFFT